MGVSYSSPNERTGKAMFQVIGDGSRSLREREKEVYHDGEK